MKKIFAFFLVACMAFSLTACSEKEQTVTLIIEDSGVYGEYTIKAAGDLIHTIEQTTTMDCSGYTEDQLDILQDFIDEYKAIYADIEGVTYDASISETAMVETIKIDVSNEAAVSALTEADLLPLEGEGDLSFEKTVASMKEQGWTEKESTDK